MKKLTSVLLVFCFILLSLPALAAENKAEEVLLKVKEKIDIPQEFTEFNYSENKYDDILRYDFSWHTKEYTKELYVTSDSHGRIVSYNYFEQTDYSAEKTLINYTISEAQPLAEAFVKRLYPEYFTLDAEDKLVLDTEKSTGRYSGRYKTFSFTFKRMYKDYMMESNSVTVRVRATKDKIYVQNMDSSLDEKAVMPEGTEVFSEQQAEEKYEEKYPIKLYYSTDYSEGNAKVKLFYSMDKGYVSYISGDVISEVMFDRYGSVTEDSIMESMSAGGSSNKGNVTLTPEEQDEINKMANLVNQEEVEKKLRGLKLLKITDDMVLAESYTYKQKDKYFVNITFKGDSRFLSAEYNGESGEIVNIYSYITNYEEQKKSMGDNNPITQEDIEAFARELAGSKVDETNVKFTTGEKQSTMNFERLVNGVPYPENNINIRYDGENNMITRYYLSWSDDVSNFPKVEDVINKEEARKIIFAKAKLKNAYVRTDDGYVKCVTVESSAKIDAVTGNEPYSSEEEKKPYTDIENHWAEKIINVLFEHDIYLQGDKFNPDDAINQADMIRLFSACTESSAVPINLGKVYVAENAVSKGYIETAEPDKLITRKEGFETFVNILGYGEIASYDIYKSSYTDMEANGSAEILKAMGVLTGDTARGDDYLTRAEASVMVYRYLSK